MWHIIPAVIFFSLALIFFYALETADTPTPPATQHSAARPAPPLQAEALLTGQEAPPLALLRGTPVLVNFFASWCTPCVAEHPVLHRLAERKDVMLYGIGWNDTREKLSVFLDTHGTPYTHTLIDTDGKTAVAYGITGVPESFLIDAQGAIAYHLAGPLTDDIVQREIVPRLERMHE